ncbi:MAG TPA: hypothetical protein VIF33_08585 [Casimicrobiaceae bacterium]
MIYSTRRVNFDDLAFRIRGAYVGAGHRLRDDRRATADDDVADDNGAHAVKTDDGAFHRVMG